MKKMFFIVVLLSVYSCAQAAEFVIEKKTKQETTRYSRTQLKEKIGNLSKDAFHASRGLARHLGKTNMLLADLREKKYAQLMNQNDLAQAQRESGQLQVTIAALQKKFSATIECLLDNRAPFKRAGRNDLSAAHKTMYDIAASLEQHKQQIKSCQQSLDKNLRTVILQKIPDADFKLRLQALNDQRSEAARKLGSSVKTTARAATQLQAQFKVDNCLKQIS